MAKAKKNMLFLLVSMVSLSLCLSIVACVDDGKYDISIKVVNTQGDEFIFTPDVDEISAIYQYTGEEVGYYVDAYNMPDHPKYGDVWLEPMQQGYDYISMYGLYTAPDGSTTDITANRVTKDIGRYAFNVYISDRSVSWHGRNICLYVTILLDQI